MNHARACLPRRPVGLRARSTARPWFAWWWGALLLTGLLPAANLTGAETPSGESEKRVLLIIETSAAMKKRVPAIEQTLRELVLTGFNQFLNRGDTIGLWTFNEWLGAGEFPLQGWAPETARLTAGLVTDFVKARRYDGAARPETVWPELNRLIQSSETLLVCWVTAGEQPMQGTPFDREINAVFREHHRALRRSQLAFVTMLYARGGAIINYSQNSTGGPILVPTTAAPGFTDPVAMRPKPEPPAPSAQAPAVAQTSAPVAKPAPKATAPLIVEKGVIKSAPWTNEPARVFTNVVDPIVMTNRPAPAPTPAPTSVAAAPSAPPSPTPPAAAGSEPTPGARQTTSPPPTAKATLPDTTPGPPPTITPRTTPSAPAPSGAEATAPPTPAPLRPAPVPAVETQAVTPAVSPAARPVETSRSAPPAVAEPSPEARPPASPTGPAPRFTPPPPPAEVATATPTVNLFGAWLTVALLVLCILLAGICIGLLLARRRFERASLITEAFERERRSDRGPSAP